MSYTTLNNFGTGTSSTNDALVYLVNPTLQASFITASDARQIGKGTKPYRDYFSDTCALNWGAQCDIAVADNSRGVPVNNGDYKAIMYDNLTIGDLVLRDTATKKYLRGVNASCKPKVSQYNTLVPSSPYSSSFNDCAKSFGIAANTVNTDPVMNRLLDRPEIAPEVLKNIYLNITQNGNMEDYKNTRLYAFFGSSWFKRMM